MTAPPEPAPAHDPGVARLLRATTLDAPHGFSTRLAGVSAGVFHSLNFGNPGDLPASDRDPPANIAANFALVLNELGLADRELVQVHQVHGAAVRVVQRGGPAHDGPSDTLADAVVTDDPRRALAVRVADCAPVLLASPRGEVVSAVHAGWRGVALGVVHAAIAAMRRLGASEIHAAIGPCIGPGAFEVGPEVAAELAHAVGHAASASIRPGRGDRLMVDLRGLLATQLGSAGVTAPEQVGGCTASRPELFFSHRRDRGLTGRHVALIAPRA